MKINGSFLIGGCFAFLAVVACSSNGSSGNDGGAGGSSSSAGSATTTSGASSSGSLGPCPSYQACNLLLVSEVNNSASIGATTGVELDPSPTATTVNESVTCTFAGTSGKILLDVQCSLKNIDEPAQLVAFDTSQGDTVTTVPNVGTAAVWDSTQGQLSVFVGQQKLIELTIRGGDGGMFPGDALGTLEQLANTVADRL